MLFRSVPRPQRLLVEQNDATPDGPPSNQHIVAAAPSTFEEGIRRIAFACMRSRSRHSLMMTSTAPECRGNIRDAQASNMWLTPIEEPKSKVQSS